MLAVLAVLGIVPVRAQAYYELAPVSIDLGQAQVDVTAGSSRTIACSIDPESERQLPGCGMEECPEGCGEGCMNDKGWCTCAGNSYETYDTKVSVTSSAPTVASASYADGSLKVVGKAAGTAVLTITAKLAKHVDATATVKVTVASAPKGEGNGNAAGTSQAGGFKTAPSTGGAGKSSRGGSKGGSKSGSAGGSGSGKTPAKGTGVTAASTKKESRTGSNGIATGALASKAPGKKPSTSRKGTAGGADADGTEMAAQPAGDVSTSLDLSRPAAEVLATLDVRAGAPESERAPLTPVFAAAFAVLVAVGVARWRLMRRRGW